MHWWRSGNNVGTSSEGTRSRRQNDQPAKRRQEHGKGYSSGEKQYKEFPELAFNDECIKESYDLIKHDQHCYIDIINHPASENLKDMYHLLLQHMQLQFSRFMELPKDDYDQCKASLDEINDRSMLELHELLIWNEIMSKQISNHIPEQLKDTVFLFRKNLKT